MAGLNKQPPLVTFGMPQRLPGVEVQAARREIITSPSHDPLAERTTTASATGLYAATNVSSASSSSSSSSYNSASTVPQAYQVAAGSDAVSVTGALYAHPLVEEVEQLKTNDSIEALTTDFLANCRYGLIFKYFL